MQFVAQSALIIALSLLAATAYFLQTDAIKGSLEKSMRFYNGTSSATFDKKWNDVQNEVGKSARVQ